MSEKKMSPLRQKDIRTGAEQERRRIFALLEKMYEDEYGKTLTLGKVIWLIKDKAND